MVRRIFISLFVCDFLIINLPDAFFLDPLPLPLDDPEGSSGWIGSLSLPFRLSRLCLLCLLLRPPALTDRGRVINVMIMRKVHNTNKRYCLHCCKHFIFDFWCWTHDVARGRRAKWQILHGWQEFAKGTWSCTVCTKQPWSMRCADSWAWADPLNLYRSALLRNFDSF